MPQKNGSATYGPGSDEAGFALALICLLLGVSPVIVALLVPTSFEELNRVDGLHRTCGALSTLYSFFVLLLGYGLNHLRSVLICAIAGSVLFSISFITGTGCCSGLIAWIQGHLSINDLPKETLVSATLSPIGSLLLMSGHSLNLRWARKLPRKPKRRH